MKRPKIKNLQGRKRESKKMKKMISAVTAKSAQSTPPQTPPKKQCSTIANSQLMHDRAHPTTVMEPNNPIKSLSLPSCSFSGEPSTKKPNMRRSFSVFHRGVSGPSLNSEETAAPDSVDECKVTENSVAFTCRCGKGFKVLLYNNKLYYKLL